MSNLLRSYTKITGLLHELEPKNYFLNQVRLPKLNDKQLIALSLAAEALGIDSERYLFKQIPNELKPMIERSVYHRRRRSLAFKIEEFRQTIASQITPSSQHHIIDSMPVEICKFARANRSKICRDSLDQSPNHGYCAAQKTRITLVTSYTQSAQRMACSKPLILLRLRCMIFMTYTMLRHNSPTVF